MAVSALEHVESETVFAKKLAEIATGTAENGVVCLIINSEVQEENRDTGAVLVPQFEVNLPTDRILAYIENSFAGWRTLKQGVSEQVYEIPRRNIMSRLTTKVVTYVARKEEEKGSGL